MPWFVFAKVIIVNTKFFYLFCAFSLPSDFFDKPTKQQPLVSHTSDDDSDDDDDEHTPSSVKPIQTSSSGLPAGNYNLIYKMLKEHFQVMLETISE